MSLRSAFRLFLLLTLTAVGSLLASQLYTAVSFPTHLRLLPGQEYTLRVGPLVRAESKEGLLDRAGGGQVALRADEVGSGGLELSLLGIPVRRTEVDIVPRLHLVPGGQSVGVMMGDGVTVTQLAKVYTVDGQTRAPAEEAGVRPGDVIRRVGGQPISHGAQLEAAAQEYGARGESMPLTIERQGALIELFVMPQRTVSSGRSHWVIGVWVREQAAGVGTLTFWDPITLRYGALGHQVAANVPEGASNQPIGRLIEASIEGITPGQRGKPGEKIGIFTESATSLGAIDKNTPYGIYGTLSGPLAPDQRALPVALSHEIEVGPATILTVLDGQKVEEFEIQITGVSRQSNPNDKGLQLRVTDRRLLDATNGIVQGMSGSPILQNGRIVGAVTHVFVNDPHRGYGILAEWMAYEAGLDVHRRAAVDDLPRAS